MIFDAHLFVLNFDRGSVDEKLHVNFATLPGPLVQRARHQVVAQTFAAIFLQQTLKRATWT